MLNHSLCGVLKRDGSDCPIPVEPGTSFNVCPKHLRAITEYARDARSLAVKKYRLRMPCPTCGVRALIAIVGERTATCASCGHEIVGADPTPVPRPRPRQMGSVVYYIRFGERIKIGTTFDLEQRLAALPHDEVLLTEPGGVELEKQRHRQFNAHLIAGREWFEAHPDLLAFIAKRKAALAAA